jgi:O-antigen ligase
MFSIPGIVGLIVCLYARPADIFPSLTPYKLLHVSLLLSIIGILVDLRLRLIRFVWSPLCTHVVVFYLWCGLTGLAAHGPAEMFRVLALMMPTIVAFFLLSWGADSFRGLHRFIVVTFVCSLLVAVVCTHQALQPLTCCAVIDERTYIPDERSCERPRDCREDPTFPDVEYSCERPGWLGTTSVAQGRVRFKGKLEDPNECALCIGAGLPFLVTWTDRKKKASRYLVAGALGLLAIFAIIQTQSRGGIFVVLTVIALTSTRDLQFKRLLFALPMGLPMLFLGGRSGEEAESSSLERLECWATGVDLFRQYPIFGVGQGQFTEHHFLTAHNAYVLAAAELGLFGAVCWLSVIYFSIKICATAFLKYRLVPDAQEGARTAFTIGAMLVGFAVGIFFLSFAYHYVLWIHVGLAGGLYNVILRHDPTFSVKFTKREAAILAVVYLATLKTIEVYARSKV